MFEDSLLESQAAPASMTRRWTMAGSTVLQLFLAALLIALPFFRPEQLSLHVSAPLVFTPPPPRPPLPVQQVRSTVPQTSTIPSIPASSRPLLPSLRPLISQPDSPPIANLGPTFDTKNAIPSEFAAIGNHQPQVSVATAPKQQTQLLKVSDGVSAGLLITPIRPIYPAIARAARISGKVVVEAIISKTGRIESLHVISGPEMLRSAAIDAIRAARYQPFRLNGEPVEVQTTITVNFTLAG